MVSIGSKLAPVVLALAAGLAVGCSGRQTTVFPTDFEPAPPLGEPPAPDPGAPGVEYLVSVAPGFSAPWGAFLDDLRLRLPPDHELNRSTLSVLLLIDLDAQGELIAMRVARPSGSKKFDDAALEVAREAIPLPRPPVDWLSDDDRLHLEWRFSRDERQAGAATARIRRVEWPIERALPALLARGRIGPAAERVVAAARAANNGGAVEASLMAGFRNVCAAVVERALASDDTGQQAAGVAAALAAGMTQAAPALRRLASGSIDPAVRRAALLGLGQLRDEAAVPLLRQVALVEVGKGNENSAAAAAALLAMGQDGPIRAPTAARLRSSNAAGRWAALAVMTQVPVPDAVPDLIELLRGNGGVPRAERITAAAALGAVAAHRREGADAAIAALTDCLSSVDAAQRAACAQAIGAAGAEASGAAAYRKLLALLRDRDESVRAAATRAAARLDPERFARSVSRLWGERSDLVRVAQAEGLAAVPGKRALARLRRLAANSSSAVRLAAVASLTQRREPRAAEILARLAAHRDAAVRALAVRGERRPDALRAAMRDQAPQVRSAALATLAEIEGRWRALPDAASMIAEAPADSVERINLASAWMSSQASQAATP